MKFFLIPAIAIKFLFTIISALISVGILAEQHAKYVFVIVITAIFLIIDIAELIYLIIF